MKPLLLDTNVLVRFVCGEPARQAEEVAGLFQAVADGKAKLAVLPMVLAEAVFVLNGFYGHSRAKVADALSHLLACPGFEPEDREPMLRAPKLFGAGSMDFVDCYLAAASIAAGRTVVSFDKDFDKLHGVARKRPGDCAGR